MTIYKQGDVILIPFPFTDLATLKKRPVLVLSSSRFNRQGGDIIIAAITSRLLRVKSASTYELNTQEQKAAGLPKRSVVKVAHLVTVEKIMVQKRIGYLPKQSMGEIIQTLVNILTEHGERKA